jgi:hypothetical protein
LGNTLQGQKCGDLGVNLNGQKWGGHKGHLYTPSYIHQMPSMAEGLNKVRDWTTFEDLMRAGKTRAQEAKTLDDSLRATGERVANSALANYDPDTMFNLAAVVGQKNYGIRHKPYLGSEASARMWLLDKQSKAKPGKEQEYWNKWGIHQADLDNDPSTPDNIITFSDVANGKIRAVDGYELMPRLTKEVQRGYYQALPTPKLRQQTTPEMKRLLRAYYRKFPTPEKQLQNPLKDFHPKPSAYQLVRDTMSNMLKMFGFKIYSKAQPDGNISGRHYMTILQHITPLFYRHALSEYFELPQNYNWELDSYGIKTKKRQKEASEAFSTIGENGNTEIWNIASKIANYIFNDGVQGGVQKIIAKEGPDRIRIAPAKDTMGNNVLNIQDVDAAERPKIIPMTRAELEGYANSLSSSQPRRAASLLSMTPSQTYTPSQLSRGTVIHPSFAKTNSPLSSQGSQGSGGTVRSTQTPITSQPYSPP